MTLTMLAPGSCRAGIAGPEEGLDARGWELVSPVWKNGGAVGAPETDGAGDLQAAGTGGAVAFGSPASFGDAEGAAPVNQYLAQRGAGGWNVEDLTPPLLSGTYISGPFQLFSSDLGRAILANGWSCRDAEESCPAANPPLGSGAPGGYRNLYLREGSAYQPLITTADAPQLTTPAEWFSLSLSGATPGLGTAVISTCSALTSEATEVSAEHGCDGAAQNLYRWRGGQLELLNVLPGEAEGTPGASLAAPSGAISEGGSGIYFVDQGALYVRDGSTTKQVDAVVGGGGEFQTATSDGSVAFFTRSGHLYRFAAASASAADLTPAGEVEGVLGASSDGSYVYYATAAGVYMWHGGTVVKIASAAQASDYPPSSGTARVSAAGTRLLFLSRTALTGYDNRDRRSGEPDSEVYLYDALANGGAGALTCVSCNPAGVRPLGPSTIPGSRSADGGPPVYQPRVLSEEADRVFFDSTDSLLSADTDGRQDVYEWEQSGAGSCTRPGGCLGLVSDGRGEGAAFADASTSGDDVYFTTPSSLVPADPGAVDLYDAKAGGGFAEPAPQIPCEGDECQGPPPAAPGPTPGTETLNAPPNPPVKWPVHPRPCRKGFVRRTGKCVTRHRRHRHHHDHHRKRRRSTNERWSRRQANR